MASCVVAIQASDGARRELLRTLGSSGARSIECETVPGERAVVTGWFADGPTAAAVTRSLRSHGFHATVGALSRGASAAWRRHTAPVEFGPGCCVCFPWSIFDRTGWSEVIEIDPGAGFGAGRHPTTRMVLETLGPTGPHFQRQRVLDVGCGSGVLSVAAALRGADVVGIDTAAAAVDATLANARLNGVATRVRAATTLLGSLDEPPFDMILANIHAPTLASMARDFIRLGHAATRLVLSGISPAQAGPVAAAMAPLKVVDRREVDGWALIELT